MAGPEKAQPEKAQLVRTEKAANGSLFNIFSDGSKKWAGVDKKDRLRDGEHGKEFVDEHGAKTTGDGYPLAPLGSE